MTLQGCNVCYRPTKTAYHVKEHLPAEMRRADENSEHVVYLCEKCAKEFEKAEEPTWQN